MSQRYLRSVNIAHDYTAQGHELQGYMATPLVWQTLHRIVQGVADAQQGRAFSIIGPYGTGKSAFGVFLAHWMDASPEKREGLRTRHATMHVAYESNHARLKSVPLMVKSGSLRQSIVASLVQQLTAIPEVDTRLPLLQELRAQSVDSDIPAERVADLVMQTSMLVAQLGIADGLLLIIDELGQHLAHIHRTGDVRDLFVLQTLAEAAARSGSTPVVVVTILHQTFERYNTTASVAQQTEWAKVQGRYVDLVFQEPQSQMMRFVAQVVKGMVTQKAQRTVVKQLAAMGDQLGVRPTDISPVEWRAMVEESYPLHPTVLVALPMLFRHLAQNERSLFAFLTAQERGGFIDVLSRTPDGTIYRLADLFEYVEQTLGPSLFGRARGRAWLEVSETLHRHAHIDELARMTMVTVGVLAALNDDRLLRPSSEIVAWAVGDTEARTFAVLQQFQQAQILVYSQYRQRWRLAEASDINLDEKLRVIRGDMAAQRHIVQLLDTYVHLDPVTAYQHSYYSGTLRTFAVRFVSVDTLISQHNTTQHNTTQHNTTQHNMGVTARFGTSS